MLSICIGGLPTYGCEPFLISLTGALAEGERRGQRDEVRAVSQIWKGGQRMVEASPWLQAASLSNCSASEGCGFLA
jgi:hypothetical protein